ncbi:MAG: hypothetical protein R3C56_39835 [Pirellulaceae bacterium]
MCSICGTSFLARFGDAWYPFAVRWAGTGMLVYLVWLLVGKPILRPHWRVLPAVAVGLMGIGLWIGLASLHGRRFAQWLPAWLRPEPKWRRNPLEHLSKGEHLGVHFDTVVGNSRLDCALAERAVLAWFSTALADRPRVGTRATGRVYAYLCLTVTLMFTLAHPEWLAAAIYCLLIGGLLYWKKDLWLCVVAHGVSNGIGLVCVDHWGVVAVVGW